VHRPEVGELDEEMVAESRKGETFILGASTWQSKTSRADRVVVRRTGSARQDAVLGVRKGPGRPVELGRALGAFCRDSTAGSRPAVTRRWPGSRANYKLDPLAAQNLTQYMIDQRTQTRDADRCAITVEALSRRARRCPHLFALAVRRPRPRAVGARARAPTRERARYPCTRCGPTTGIALGSPMATCLPTDDQLTPDPDDVEPHPRRRARALECVREYFRENAARAVAVPRRRPGRRTPLWAQRLKAAADGRRAAVPGVSDHARDLSRVLRDVFDLPALLGVLKDIRSRAIRSSRRHRGGIAVRAFAGVRLRAAFLSRRCATRRAQRRRRSRSIAISARADRRRRAPRPPHLEVMDAVEAELQQTRARAPGALARQVHDLVRRVGDLDAREIAGATAEVDVPAVIAELVERRRLAAVRIAGVERYIAAETPRVTDGLGVALPQGLPAALARSRRGSADLVGQPLRAHARAVHRRRPAARGAWPHR